MEQTCKNIQEQIPDFLMGALPPEKVAELQQHIDRCPSCKSYLQSLQADDKLLSNFAKSLQPALARLENNVINTLAQKTSVKPAKTVSLWRIIMKSKITKLAAAAAIIVAVLTGIHYFGGSIEGTSVAWADVAKKIEQIQAFTYRINTSMTGAPNIPKGKTVEGEMEALNSLEYGIRGEMYANGNLISITYMNPGQKAVLSVMPSAKKYMRMSLTDSQIKEQQARNDPREMVKHFTSFGYKKLGNKIINGKQTSGIEVNDPRIFGGTFETFVGNLWVDVKTELPVLMELEATADRGAMQMKMVFDDFKWDVNLAPSVFEPNIPADYTLMAEVQAPDVKDEGKAVQGLRIFAEIANGKYPTKLSMLSLMKEFPEAAKKGNDIQETGEPSKEMMEKMFKVQAVWAFYANLVKENKDPAYYGDKVTVEDANSVLMRWKISENEYRVIFGDLKAENVSSERLMELEKKYTE